MTDPKEMDDEALVQAYLEETDAEKRKKLSREAIVRSKRRDLPLEKRSKRGKGEK
jgi:hypothetical protein